jgi:hypothetical protein
VVHHSPNAQDPVVRQSRWVKLQAVIPADLYVVWDEVCERLRAEGVDHGNDLVRNGIVIEILCAEYLSQPKQRG